MKPWLAIILVFLFALLLSGCRAFDCGCPMH
jgi:predicted small secreted protein